MKKIPKVIESLSDDKLTKIQNKLLKTRVPLYIDKVKVGAMRRKSYYSGLNYLLFSNKKYDTLYSTTNRLQCQCDKNRSQGDLFMIMRYYYPDITFKEFRATLFKLLNGRKVNTFFCSNINKRIFYKHELTLKRNFSFMSSLTTPDEFDLTLVFDDDIERDDTYDLYESSLCYIDDNNFDYEPDYVYEEDWR